MAPRRATTRMDAAVDAMTPFGFSKELVRKTMSNLLKVYGDAGWAFIEADAYKVLIEEILAGEEEARKQAESSMKVDSAQDDRVGLAIVGPSKSIESACSRTPKTAQRGDGNRWKDIVLYETCSPDDAYSADPLYCPVAPGPFPQPLNAASPAPPIIPAQRRPPCYGWIDDDDEEEETEFVLLTPAIIASASPAPSPPREEQMESLGNRTVKTPKRRSRWDLKPEDM